MLMDKQLLAKTFKNTSLATIYIFLVSQLIRHGEDWFGEDNLLTPFVFLLLFSLSAAIVSGLVLGQSIFLFFENQKTQSLKAAIYSIGWLGFYTILGLLTLVIVN